MTSGIRCVPDMARFWSAKTGDKAIRDRDGNLFLVDRVKDMIVSAGENIYSPWSVHPTKSGENGRWPSLSPTPMHLLTSPTLCRTAATSSPDTRSPRGFT